MLYWTAYAPTVDTVKHMIDQCTYVDKQYLSHIEHMRSDCSGISWHEYSHLSLNSFTSHSLIRHLISANNNQHQLILTRLTHADNPCPRLGPFSTGWKLMNVFKLEEFQSQKPFFTTKTDEFQGTVFPCVRMYVCVYVCCYEHTALILPLTRLQFHILLPCLSASLFGNCTRLIFFVFVAFIYRASSAF